MNLDNARSNMIEQQVRPWDVLDQRVLDALAQVPREAFVSEQHAGIAYSDFQLPIGQGQHMLKPIVDGRLLQSLAIEPDDHIIEIGTGSGYLTACLASLGGVCESIEIEPLLADAASARLGQLGIDNVVIHREDGARHWGSRERYDAIAFGGAVGAVPRAWQERMAIGGRLFAIIGDTGHPTMEALLLMRVSETEWNTESLFETTVDPLLHFDVKRPAFIF